MENKKIKVSFDMTPDQLKALDEYCKITDLKRTEAMRLSVTRLLERSPVENQEEVTVRQLERKLNRIKKIIEE